MEYLSKKVVKQHPQSSEPTRFVTRGQRNADVPKWITTLFFFFKLFCYSQNLTSAARDLDSVDSELADTSNRIETANNRIESLKRRIEALKRAAEQLRLDAMNIKELNLGGQKTKIQKQFLSRHLGSLNQL